ncbi:hypothetical protein DESUT3_28170 [Desulfuromonas versatilis]|uniref:Response regulatory domain-containing protein n=1 Tax=Desulfuromonas versatilis TaxID=2802975 RepID=A0ABN6E060_9BACT|nr:response regulator [Desulfuromonas versatilis]BCR05748.1 hypothetical protein DESUT3_28170 [Desulfuromonas versatilis]
MSAIRTLIVDPAADRRKELQLLLADQPVEITEAASSERALELLKNQLVEVVLTDTELPGKSGLYLLQTIKKNHPEIEVIVLSHNASSFNVLQALRNGAADFIVRPVDTGEPLINALNRAIDHLGRRRRQELRLRELERKNGHLNQMLARMKSLQNAVDKLASAQEVGVLLQSLVDTAMAELGADKGVLALVDQASNSLGIKAGGGIPASVTRIFSNQLPAGLLVAMARRGKPVLIPGELPEGLARLSSQAERQILLTRPGLISAPLRIREKAVGLAVVLGHAEQKPFDEQDLHYLLQLSHHATIVLEKLGLIHQLKRGREIGAFPCATGAP